MRNERRNTVFEEKEMNLEIRKYTASDAERILSWCKDEIDFYRWTAGILGEYPLTAERFSKVEELMPFTACDENGPVGFFTLRRPAESENELRFGFVIADPAIRGKGYGKRMLLEGIRYIKDNNLAEKVSLGVFADNPNAYYCYKAAGFHDVEQEEHEYYSVMGQEWECLELEQFI